MSLRSEALCKCGHPLGEHWGRIDGYKYPDMKRPLKAECLKCGVCPGFEPEEPGR